MLLLGAVLETPLLFRAVLEIYVVTWAVLESYVVAWGLIFGNKHRKIQLFIFRCRFELFFGAVSIEIVHSYLPRCPKCFI